jgi:Flp pilus assembly protein TadG
MARIERARSSTVTRRQGGSVSTELVVATPLLLLLVMVVVQFALWEHAQHIAEAAAQRGAEMARVERGTDAQGRTTAQTAIAQLGSSLLVNPLVSVARTGDVVTVSVSASAEAVVPFLSLPVHATAAGPVERFVAPAAAGP